jgi:ribosomal protein S18 acetylase RimI-like enzyme
VPICAIRPYQSTDRAAVIEALVELQDSEVPLHDTRLPGRQVAEPYFRELLEMTTRQSGQILVAMDSNILVGIVVCFVVEDETISETADSNRYGYVSDIYVRPSHRGSGLAQRLLVAAENYIAGTGVVRIRINVLAANSRARGAYEKYGFAPYEVMYEKRIGSQRNGR